MHSREKAKNGTRSKSIRPLYFVRKRRIGPISLSALRSARVFGLFSRSRICAFFSFHPAEAVVFFDVVFLAGFAVFFSVVFFAAEDFVLVFFAADVLFVVFAFVSLGVFSVSSISAIVQYYNIFSKVPGILTVFRETLIPTRGLEGLDLQVHPRHILPANNPFLRSSQAMAVETKCEGSTPYIYI